MFQINILRFFFLSILLSVSHTSSLFSNEGLVEEVVCKESIDNLGVKTVITYDSSKRVRKSTQYNASGQLMSDVDREYDVKGNKLLERYAVICEGVPVRQFTLHWTYDDKGRLLSTSEGDGKPLKTTRFLYHDKERLFTKIKPDGVSLTYRYDVEWRLISLKASDDSVYYIYRYDVKNRLVEVEDLIHQTKQIKRYGNGDELVEESLGNGIVLTHAYDEQGNRIRTTLPDQSEVVYQFQEGLLKSIKREGNHPLGNLSFVYSYDEEHQPICLDCSERELSVRWSYDQNGKLDGIASPWWSQEVMSNGEESEVARIIELRTSDSTGRHSEHFEYSDDKQLLCEEGHFYGHDSLWNRVEHNGERWEVNALNQLISTPEVNCNYHKNGCVSSKQTAQDNFRFIYDALDRLIRIEQEGQFASDYIYDASYRLLEHRRFKYDEGEWRLVASDRYLYDGRYEIGKMDQKGCLVEFRILGQGFGADLGAAVAIELGERRYFPVHDHRGSVCCLIDLDSKRPVEYYTYSGFTQKKIFDGNGDQLTASMTGNPWTFYSKREDKDSHLFNFGYRWYDPQLACWITPDPLFSHDCPNLYAFVKNDPINFHDLHGLFSVNAFIDWTILRAFTFLRDIQGSVLKHQWQLCHELNISEDWFKTRVLKHLFGETYELLGVDYDETSISTYGRGEVNDKVRVTFINGILTTRSMFIENLEVISSSHGNVNVHYVFRPTEGWVWDISRAVVIKAAYCLGFCSMHAHILANLWKELIREMGGVDGGGVIVHYAHSLGATETDRARELLTLEEQQMIRVITCGPATYVKNVGFQSVVNHVSIDDGVANDYVLEPIGLLRYHLGDPALDVRFHGNPYDWPTYPLDHAFGGETYGTIIRQAGESFLREFVPDAIELD